MATPSYFTPQKKSDSGRPPPAPPRVSKRQIYTDPSFFEEVDDHAIAVAKVGYRTFRDLIWNLVFKKDYNELQKARAIFRWMTMKKSHVYSFDGMKANSPDAVMQGFRNGVTVHSRALECLALHAGLHCIVLNGWAKAAAYKAGSSITGGLANHSWNAVHISGNWRFMEGNWAARSNAEYEDFYFIPDPDQFIYSHFPEDSAWQLCSPVRSKAEFDEYPVAESGFFNIGMKFLQQNQGIIFTHNGILVLTLGLTQPTALIFKVKYGDHGQETMQGMSLKRFVAQETTEQRVSFYVRAPQNGTYYLTIYAQHIPRSLKLKQLYDDMCTYKIICDNAVPGVKPFPECANSSYGPGVCLKQYGLTSSQDKGILKVSSSSFSVVLKKSRPVKFLVRLRNEALSDQVLEKAVTVEEQDSQVTIKCNLPDRGEYGLAIYANEPGKGSDTYTHICQYLLPYNNQDLKSIYGEVYDHHYSIELVRYNYSPDVYVALAGEPYQAGPSEQRLPVVNSQVEVQSAPPPRAVTSSGQSESIRSVIQSLEEGLQLKRLSTQRAPSAARTPPVPSSTTAVSSPISAPCSNPEGESRAEPSSSSVTSPMGRFTCPICFEDDKQIQNDRRKLMSTTCGHIFCETCINGVLESQQRCPTCRNSLSRTDIHPIYL